MATGKHPSALIGLDIGGVHSRASVVAVTEGRYRFFGSAATATSLGEGVHIGAGVGQALNSLQAQSEHLFLKDSGGLLMPVDRIGRGIDHIGMVISTGPQIRTMLLGLSPLGSLRAGRALIESLPLRLIGSLGLSGLIAENRAIEALIKAHPEIIVISGGEDSGATAPVQRWIDIVRTACLLLPPALHPVILYAGNQESAPYARRRLEPVAKLQVTSNLQPLHGVYDLVPVQVQLEREILRAQSAALPGLEELIALAENCYGLPTPGLVRMMRFLSQAKAKRTDGDQKSGVLAVDLGSMSTTLSAGVSGEGGAVVLDTFPDLGAVGRLTTAQAIVQWVDEPVCLEEAEEFLCNFALNPGWVPTTRRGLTLALAFARYRLQQACTRFSANYPWMDYHHETGLVGHFEPVIASGAVLTEAPEPTAVMLTLLDGLQPREITTMVLDRHHLLPLLGKFTELEPVLPVQVLSSPAFENLGTVISVVGRGPQRRTALTVGVETASGKHFSTEVQHGTLRRLAIPAGEAAVLTLEPHRHVEIGFGGRGRGGRLKIVGGVLGAIIDARGRPLLLPDKVEPRIALLQAWQQMMRADHA